MGPLDANLGYDRAAGSRPPQQLGWHEVWIGHQHGPFSEGETYVPSDVYESRNGEFKGLHLVLEQRANRADVAEWHVHQDLVLALGLKREKDAWVSPDGGYIDVIRLHRRDDGSPRAIEIRAEHLRDYLSARGMALYVTSYRSRRVVVEDASPIAWGANPVRQLSEGDRWEGRVCEIHEGGAPYGSTTAVFSLTRTNVDPEEDVPQISIPTDENVDSRSWTAGHKGRKLYLISGELWRNEWVDPGQFSPRVRGDELSPTVFFITDAQGTRESRDTLADSGRWLWFRADVIVALIAHRGGGLSWYTRDTGSVACSPDHDVPFGVNRIGLVNAYAKDVALLPEWQQKIWAGHNVAPDGGVSEELLAAQARGIPADSQAPESFLLRGIELVNTAAADKFGIGLFREHAQIGEIVSRAHRFRATDIAGLLGLAKDLARLTADSIDTSAVHKLLSTPKDKHLGSLKSLEELLASKLGPTVARQYMAPLVGIYELRHADAHLPSGDLEASFRLAGVDPASATLQQGYQLLHSCVSSLFEIARAIQEWGTPGADESEA